MTLANNNIYLFLLESIMDIVDYDDEINEQTSFEDIGLESLDFIELQTLVKKEYGIQVSANDCTENEIINLSTLCNFMNSEMIAA